MTDTAYRIPRHSVGLTIFLLMAGATLGAVWGLFLSSFVATASLAAGGPLALLIAGPLLFAIYGVGTTYIVFGAPLWALFGGMWFAASSSRDTGSAATQMGVTFFSKSHPINQATQQMAQQLDLPPVRYVGWFGSDDVNAFAMGTSNRYALVAVSKGAIENLSQEQLDAVIAHELGHIASNDMERMTYALGVRESLTFFLIFRGLKKFARWVFTPLSELELLRFSRAREFTADAISAHLTSSEAMISVLETLKGAKLEPQPHNQAFVMMAALGDNTLFSTHPSLDDRINALRALPVSTSVQQPDQETSVPSPQPISS